MRPKTTRAFRTISEAGEELGLQPHVLRFWESKFSEIKPIKRGGGRRFYRPEDIELLRGIKILLHDEKHPIKDVQKLIRIKGPARVIELGRTIEQAANPKKIKDTVLVPERIQAAAEDEFENDVKNIDADMDANEFTPRSDPQGDARSYDEDSPVRGDDVDESEEDFVYERETELDTPLPFDDDDDSDDEEDNVDVEQLEDALNTLTLLRARWKTFTST